MKIRKLYSDHKRAIHITFELFWIIVFLLEMTANQTSSSIPQFIYVNF